MFKVALINPPERILDRSFKHYLPFSLLYLAAYLEENSINVDIVDIKRQESAFDIIKGKIKGFKNLYSLTIEEIIEEAILTNAGLIGISCMTAEYASAMKLAFKLKEKLNVPIVIGGIHPSLYPEQFIYKTSPVDFVVIGEGEETLLELSKCLEAGRRHFAGIDGIAYLKDGHCQLNQIRALDDKFLISPIKVYKKLDMQFYTKPHAYVTRHVRISGVQIFTSRGCPYNCTFCSNPLVRKLNKKNKPVRYRPVESVIEEIKFLRDKYYIDSFYIMDDTFCIEKKRVEEFCSELKNAGINLAWAAETRSNLVDESILSKMKDAGLVQLDVGVESGSDEMLQELQKGITVKDTLSLFSLCRKHKIRTFASLMVNLPQETAEQLQETIGLLDKIRPSAGVIGATTPLPKTELFNRYFTPKLKNDQEIIELFGPHLNDHKVKDARFHLSKYNVDISRLINRLIIRYFLFSELRLGLWYWRVFFKSKRKLQYLFSILLGAINIIERLITRGAIWKAYRIK